MITSMITSTHHEAAWSQDQDIVFAIVSHITLRAFVSYKPAFNKRLNLYRVSALKKRSPFSFFEAQTKQNHLYIYMILIHENHVFELRVETKFEVCDPRSFLTPLM